MGRAAPLPISRHQKGRAGEIASRAVAGRLDELELRFQLVHQLVKLGRVPVTRTAPPKLVLEKNTPRESCVVALAALRPADGDALNFLKEKGSVFKLADGNVRHLVNRHCDVVFERQELVRPRPPQPERHHRRRRPRPVGSTPAACARDAPER